MRLLAKGLNADDGGARHGRLRDATGGAVFSVGSISYPSSLLVDDGRVEGDGECAATFSSGLIVPAEQLDEVAQFFLIQVGHCPGGQTAAREADQVIRLPRQDSWLLIGLRGSRPDQDVDRGLRRL